MNHPFEGLQLAGQVPRSITDVEGSVITEMSCLGANLLYVYAPPCDESGKTARPANDFLVMFWDFPGISRTFFHRPVALAMFLPVQWLLREGPLPRSRGGAEQPMIRSKCRAHSPYNLLSMQTLTRIRGLAIPENAYEPYEAS